MTVSYPKQYLLTESQRAAIDEILATVPSETVDKNYVSLSSGELGIQWKVELNQQTADGLFRLHLTHLLYNGSCDQYYLCRQGDYNQELYTVPKSYNEILFPIRTAHHATRHAN